jgi:hypothetical protein
MSFPRLLYPPAIKALGDLNPTLVFLAGFEVKVSSCLLKFILKICDHKFQIQIQGQNNRRRQFAILGRPKCCFSLFLGGGLPVKQRKSCLSLRVQKLFDVYDLKEKLKWKKAGA